MDKSQIILIADDDPLALLSIKEMLKLLDYKIITAENGVQALEKLSEFSPDLILLDISMPIMNGLEVLKKIKEDELTKSIPVVMITSFQERDDRIKAIELGADDFLTKPVDSLELQVRVRSSLKLKAYIDGIIARNKELEAEVARCIVNLNSIVESKEENSLNIKIIEDYLNSVVESKKQDSVNIKVIEDYLNSAVQSKEHDSANIKIIEDSCDLMKAFIRKL